MGNGLHLYQIGKALVHSDLITSSLVCDHTRFKCSEFTFAGKMMYNVITTSIIVSVVVTHLKNSGIVSSSYVGRS